jgi:hypothetical protein
MRLTWRDGVATVFVAAAGGLYALWLTGNGMAGTSTRVLGAIVFALGWVGCTSNKAAMAEVFGVGAPRRAPLSYVVTASLIGAVALVAGVITVVTGNEVMLATLVIAMIVLWAMSTVRHATASQAPRHGLAFHDPVGRTA